MYFTNNILGQYYEPIPQNYDANRSLEDENELKTDELKDKINVLKSVLYFSFIYYLAYFLKTFFFFSVVN